MVLVAVQLFRAGMVSPAGVEKPPSIHPRRSFHCRSRLPCDTRGQGALVVLVAIQLSVLGIVSPAGVQNTLFPVSTPYDHFTAGPDCRVRESGSGRVGRAGGCPTIRAGIVSPAGVQRATLPIHPRRSFHCRSRLPCERLGQWAHWWCWWLSNYPCWDCISRRCSRAHRIEDPPQTIISLPVQTAV